MLPHNQTVISRGCMNRTECGHDALVGNVCTSPENSPSETRCLMCEFFLHEDPYEDPWWKCQTPGGLAYMLCFVFDLLF